MFDKEFFNDFRKDVEEALNHVAHNYGVNIKAGTIKYTQEEFTLVLEVARILGDGEMPIEQQDFERHCEQYGFTPNDYLREFDWNGDTFQLVGFNVKARKAHLICQKKEDGNRYRFHDAAVKNKFGMK